LQVIKALFSSQSDSSLHSTHDPMTFHRSARRDFVSGQSRPATNGSSSQTGSSTK
jgi:hypothetical protein